MTFLLLFRCALYSLLYGVRHTYIMFGETNYLFMWFTFIYVYGTYLYPSKDQSQQSPIDNGDAVNIDSSLLRAGHASYSLLPHEIAVETDIVPESISTSLSDAERHPEGYDIPSTAIHEPEQPSHESLDQLLEEYLHQVNQYMIQRDQLSKLISTGSFQLSKAHMQLDALRLGRSWDARMKAKVLVEIDEKGQFTLTSPPQAEISKEEKEKTEESTLRRRRTPVDNASKGGTIVEKHDHDDGSHVEEDAEKETLAFDPLYQFSALPPPSLRKAQQNFRRSLEVIVAPGGLQNCILNTVANLNALEEKIKQVKSRSEEHG